jgi:hypothetical protein
MPEVASRSTGGALNNLRTSFDRKHPLTRAFGADDGIRTRDPHLGKVS